MATCPPFPPGTEPNETYMPPSRSPWAETWHLLRQNRMAYTGLVIFLLFFAAALAGLAVTSGSHPLLDPARVRLQEKLRPPLAKPATETLRPEEIPALNIYLLGTDELGRDVFARMLQGAWVSLTVGFVAVGIAVLIGILLGGIAGYYGQLEILLGHLIFWTLFSGAIATAVSGMPKIAAALSLAAAAGWTCWRLRQASPDKPLPPWLRWAARPTVQVDTLIMRAVDIMLCFPSFFLILTVVALLPPSIYNIMVIIGLTSWMGTTRFVRAEFLSLREQDFVAAARALGISDMRIIFRHIMPNAVAPCTGFSHSRYCLRHADGSRSEFFGFRGTAAPCHLGQHSVGRQSIYIRRTLADLRPGPSHSGRRGWRSIFLVKECGIY